MQSHILHDAAQAIAEQVVAWRRDFHRHPELGLEEHRTAGIVAAHLRSLGFAVEEGVGGTGVVGLLNPGKAGRVVALRADMDALPIQDSKTCDYASTVPGKMHACGHDGHTAILMGVASLLAARREEIAGQVKLLFQPAEEGPGGALPMIEAGALTNPAPDACFALHLWSDVPVGSAAIRAGAHMAASDTIHMTVTGVGGHGAYPETSIDAIAVAGHVIVGMQQIVSRECPPLQPVVVTIGTVQGGFRNNVIAPEVKMTGTVRTLHAPTRNGMEERIRRVFEGICRTHRAEPAFSYSYGYPVTVNDPAMAAFLAGCAADVLGSDHVRTDPDPAMGGEDFAYIAERVPSAYLRLGSCNAAKGITAGAHNPGFDIDEDALPLGVAIMAHAAMRFVNAG